MKKYDPAFIKAYIEEHESEIQSVSCGMKEDWFWTAETTWKNGKFLAGYCLENKSINIAGISGSTWATPVMEVVFKDGRTEIVPCFFDDGKQASLSQIAEQMRFAAKTGGKPIYT